MDTTFELVSLRDDAVPLRNGSTKRTKVAQFYLGTFGPFTERFDEGTFSDLALQTRVSELRRHIDNLHR